MRWFLWLRSAFDRTPSHGSIIGMDNVTDVNGRTSLLDNEYPFYYYWQRNNF